jgi:predicted Zn-dependent protease
MLCWGTVVGYVILCSACQTAPITGRQQLILLSEAEETQTGLAAYQQVLKEERVSRDPHYNDHFFPSFAETFAIRHDRLCC